MSAIFKTLFTTENLTDTHYNSQSGFSVGANIGLTPATKDPKPDTKDTQTPSGTKINSEHLAFNTSTDTRVGKTLATVGEGNLNIGDTKNSSDTTNLNRDVTKVDKELYSSNTGTKVDATIDNRMFTETGQKEIKNQNKALAGNVINGVALAGNIITGNMDVDNAIASFQDPTKMADAIKNNSNLAATLDAFSKGQFDNLPKTKEGLQALADATGLQVDVLLTTVTSFQDAKGTTDKNLVALDVNPANRADIVGTLGHEESHARGGTSETLADMSGYAAQLLSEAAIGGYDQQYLNGIKFEMGTGKDSATQAANQLLLGSDNQTLLNALNDHPLEFYNAVVYRKNGKYVGWDGKKDNDIYITKNETPVVNKNDKTINLPEDATKLPVSNSAFENISGVIKKEGETNDPNEYIDLAHTSKNYADEKHKTLESLLLSSYSSVPNKTPLSNSDNSVIDNYARAGVIDALTNPVDPTSGATLWDGVDYLAWGLVSPNGTPQNKFEEYKSMSINGDIFAEYLKQNQFKYGTSINYNHGKYKFTLPQSVFTNANNWVNGDFNYNTGVNTKYGIEATTTAGRTIFWRKVK